MVRKDQAILDRLKHDPRLRTGKLADHPVMREVADIERRLRERQQRPAPASKSKTKGKRGARIKLTPDEIARGIAKVQRAEQRHRKHYPAHPLKQTEAVGILLREMRRDGKPINVSTSTWLRQVVRPALRP